MKITCVSSRYLPNIRYIARLLEVEIPVVLDLSPLPHQNKNCFISRNRIIDKHGNLLWLSLPINRKGVRNFKDAKLDNTKQNWIKKHIKSISYSYPNHKNIAGNFLERLEHSLMNNNGTLSDINSQTLNLILDILEIKGINLKSQSEIIDKHTSDHRLVISKILNATEYIAGHVEWEVMKYKGIIFEMVNSGVSVCRSPDINPKEFPNDIIEKLSIVHSLCTIGPKKTHDLIKKIVSTLKISSNFSFTSLNKNY